jgi:hypothetical protein
MVNYSKLEPQGDDFVNETVYIDGKPIILTEDPDEGDGEEENATDD